MRSRARIGALRMLSARPAVELRVPVPPRRAAVATTPRQIVWGVAGDGRIAADWCEAMRRMPEPVGAVVGAVASPATVDGADARAAAFCARHAPPGAVAHGSFEALAADPRVDVVYVGVSTPYHVEACELFLARGKAVLCEKPLAPTAAQAAALVAAARARGVFFAEGLWTRAMPAARALRRLLVDERAIGDVVAVQCDTGFASRRDDARMWHATCGGMGLDMGVYASSFALLPFGARDGFALSAVRAVGELSPCGVDVAAAASLRFEHRATGRVALAQLLYTSSADAEETVTYTGTAGSIRVHGLAHVPHALSVTRARSRTERETEVLEFARDDDDGAHAWNYPGSIGLLHQARAVSDAVRDGARENPLWTHDETLANLRVIDTIKAAIRDPA